MDISDMKTRVADTADTLGATLINGVAELSRQEDWEEVSRVLATLASATSRAGIMLASLSGVAQRQANRERDRLTQEEVKQHDDAF